MPKIDERGKDGERLVNAASNVGDEQDDEEQVKGRGHDKQGLATFEVTLGGRVGCCGV